MLGEQIHCNDCNSQFGCFYMPHVLAVYFPLVVLRRCCFQCSLQSLQRAQLFWSWSLHWPLGFKAGPEFIWFVSGFTSDFPFCPVLNILACEIFGSFPTLPPGSYPQQFFFQKLGVWLSSLPSNTQGYTQQSKYKDLYMGNVFCLKR